MMIAFNSLFNGYKLSYALGLILMFSMIKMPLYASINTNKVIQVYPTSDSIAENLLRFHVQFSNPMRKDQIKENIHVFDLSGKELHGIFFDYQYELWSKDRTVLTLLLDPGRVKTGLKANLTMGRAFVEGNLYTLVIDKGWQTVSGDRLSSTFRKSFIVRAADNKRPNPPSWRLKPYYSESLDSLIIETDTELDWVSAKSYLKLFKRDTPIEGDIKSLALGREKKWVFVPNRSQGKRGFSLRVLDTLEDPSGNNVSQNFEVAASSKKHNISNGYTELQLRYR